MKAKIGVVISPGRSHGNAQTKGLTSFTVYASMERVNHQGLNAGWSETVAVGYTQ
jgi:hypothetical protein